MLPKHKISGNSYHLHFWEGCFELVKDPITCEPETIYPWSGGACPVHPNTKVKFWERFYGESVVNRCAKTLRWDHRGLGSDIVAFQVVKEYVKPSEVFLNEYKYGFGNNFLTAEDAKKHAVSGAIRVAVKFREVRD